jgi:hypothetical protein
VYLPELKLSINTKESFMNISNQMCNLLNRAQIISYHEKDLDRQLRLDFAAFEKLILDLLEIK